MTFVCSRSRAPARCASRATAGEATAGSATASRFDHDAPVTIADSTGQRRRARRPVQKLDVETGGTRLVRRPLQLGLIACRQSQIHVPAGNDAAVLSGEAGKVLPDRLRA